MKPQPLSFNEAQALCEDAQRLIGRPLNPQVHAHGSIEHVVVAPYGDPHTQRSFVESLVQPQAGVNTPPGGLAENGFAVLIVGRPKRWLQQPVLFQDVRTYLRKHMTKPLTQAKAIIRRHNRRAAPENE